MTKKPHTIVQTFYRTGRSAHVSCTPVFDSCGEIEFYICNDRDLDEISSLQQELDKIRGLNDQYLQELESIKARMGGQSKLIVADKEMLKVLALAARIAKVDSTALLLGETGVGKDEIARFIHQNSGGPTGGLFPSTALPSQSLSLRANSLDMKAMPSPALAAK